MLWELEVVSAELLLRLVVRSLLLLAARVEVEEDGSTLVVAVELAVQEVALEVVVVGGQ